MDNALRRMDFMLKLWLFFFSMLRSFCWASSPSSLSALCSESCLCDLKSVPYFLDCSGLNISSSSWVSEKLDAIDDAILLDVDLTGNALQSLGPFSSLSVHMLSVRGNNIEKIDGLANLTFLSYLDLSYNRLNREALDSKTFEQVYSQSESNSNLIELDLSFNEISGLIDDLFTHVHNLQVLKLNGNPLRHIDDDTLKALGSLQDLQTLALSQCGLENLPRELTSSIQQVKHLDISGNKFVAVPEELKVLRSLSYLNLNNNPLEFITFNSFSGLTALEHLSLCFMDTLKQIESGAFTPLVNLITLLIHNNDNLDFLHPDAFEKWPIGDEFKLRQLVLAGNRLRYLSEMLLNDKHLWMKLDVVDISSNPWSCDCHNAWLVNDLAPMIAARSASQHELTVCGPEPAELAGVKLADVNEDELVCHEQDNFNPYQPQNNFGLTKQSTQSSRREDRLSWALIFLCVSAVVVTVGFVFGLQARAERRKVYADAVRFTNNQGRFVRPRRPGDVY